MSSPSPAASAAVPHSVPRLALVLGGARSGKSRYAESLIGDRPAIYLATAEAGDAEMALRIRAHQARRPAQWTTREAPLDLAGALAESDQPGRPILVDCLTLWLSNLLAAGRDPAAETRALVARLADIAAPVIVVSNEVGLGLVPDNALARAFRDHAGHLHQDIATIASRVVLVAAGIPLVLKDHA